MLAPRLRCSHCGNKAAEMVASGKVETGEIESTKISSGW
jgi:hypothetical protein